MNISSYFNELQALANSLIKSDETYTLKFQGETSDFCRFNNNKIRQAGHVAQHYLTVQLIKGKRHTSEVITLSLQKEADVPQIKSSFQNLRQMIAVIPEDPYLLVAESTNQSHQEDTRPSTNREQAVSDILTMGQGLDLTGIYAGGHLYRGFASSFGQCEWHETSNFNFDWSLFLKADQAVKIAYAGSDWNSESFRSKMDEGRRQLAILDQPMKSLNPGKYRVFLSPTALSEVMSLISWNGFGIKSQRTKNSSLCELVEGQQQLASIVSLSEETGTSSPSFSLAGFAKPAKVELIKNGHYGGSLVSPSSAAEYNTETNGADPSESPSNLVMESGQLNTNEAIANLDEGILINNLWYLNYSDRQKCRITGMTRFATFWVEGGEIKQPVAVMRFDESLYRMLGQHLEGLTQDRELLLSNSTYHQRSLDSMKLPGALIDEFTLTL